MTQMQHDERLARRVQAAEDRKRPRAKIQVERDAVRPRARPQDYVENIHSSADASDDSHWDQSGAGEVQVEGRAVQAPAQAVKRFADAVLQRDSDTRARSSHDPMPDSGMDMESIVTNEQCEQEIQSVLKELGFTDRNNFEEASTRYGLNQGHVLGVATTNQSYIAVCVDAVRETDLMHPLLAKGFSELQ